MFSGKSFQWVIWPYIACSNSSLNIFVKYLLLALQLLMPSKPMRQKLEFGSEINDTSRRNSELKYINVQSVVKPSTFANFSHNKSWRKCTISTRNWLETSNLVADKYTLITSMKMSRYKSLYFNSFIHYNGSW